MSFLRRNNIEEPKEKPEYKKLFLDQDMELINEKLKNCGLNDKKEAFLNEWGDELKQALLNIDIPIDRIERPYRKFYLETEKASIIRRFITRFTMKA